MVYSGPQKYPGASTAYWFQKTYGGDRMESNVGVLHTTGGTSVPSYGGGASAPNFTALPDMKNHRLVWYQHFDFDRSSRALVNKSGGVETNTMNAVQVELVGTCDPKYKTSWGNKRAGVDYIFWPDAPDWALAEVGKFVKWAHDQHKVKLHTLPQSQWKAYPSSYGATSSRLTGSEWLAFYGWCGHQHVPENSHGDPGNLRMDKILAYAKGEDLADTGGAVALTKDDIHDIWYADLIPAQPEPYENQDWHDGNKTWTVKYAVYTIVRAGREILARVKGLEKSVAEVGTPTVDLDALADRIVERLGDDLADVVADKLAERLKS
jgi:hypothetical protein